MVNAASPQEADGTASILQPGRARRPAGRGARGANPRGQRKRSDPTPDQLHTPFDSGRLLWVSSRRRNTMWGYVSW